MAERPQEPPTTRGWLREGRIRDDAQSHEGDGPWRVIGKRQTVYTLRTLSGRDAFKAVTALQKEAERQAARIKRARAKADKLSDAGGVNALAWGAHKSGTPMDLAMSALPSEADIRASF
jgi:hypothetical protein